MSWIEMYNVHVNMPTCVFWWFSTGCAKSAHFGGGVKMVVFGGVPKKGHFGPPRGARNFLHPPPGKPRQNIYYLDTRHPPGGGRFGGWFSDPPWTVGPGVCFGAIFAPPCRGAKTGILTSPVSRSTNGTHMMCKKFSCTYVMSVHHRDMKIFFVC
jgi:hypothetical protein